MAGSSKKASKESSHNFTTGDVVLAKIKGFPAWPGVLVGDHQVPKEVLAEKPKGRFIIRFFPKADYHFPGPRDLTLLTREECRAYAEDSHRKDGELKSAYKIGADPDEWIAETDATVKEAEQEREAAELEAQENEDQLQEEGDEEESKPVGKKRAAPTKKASAPKPKKAKVEKEKPSAAPASAPRKSAGADEDGEDLDDETKRVKAWRHQLQRAFLPKDKKITEKDVENQHETFEIVEAANITEQQLRDTKINKVMKRIVALEEIPLDDVHRFKERAEALVNKWNALQSGSSGAGAGATAPTSTSAAPANSDGESKPQSTRGANGHNNDVGDLTEVQDDPAVNDSAL